MRKNYRRLVSFASPEHWGKYAPNPPVGYPGADEL
jgi:hypothetical protein